MAESNRSSGCLSRRLYATELISDYLKKRRNRVSSEHIPMPKSVIRILIFADSDIGSFTIDCDVKPKFSGRSELDSSNLRRCLSTA